MTDLARDRVSVVLPYYNRPDTLLEAAGSVLEQTHRDLVLYLVNDGSADDSRQVARSLDDPRIVHIDLESNRGVSHARNVGLAVADTELVAFMDSDDVWLSHKLETQTKHLRELQRHDESISVVGCGWRMYDSDSPAKEFRPGPYSRIDVLRDQVAGIGTPMLLVNRSVAAENARFDEALPALVDRDYVMSCLANGTMVQVIPEILALVRRGRRDHVASSQRAAAAYEVLIGKYGHDFDELPSLGSWYAYRATREHLIHRDLRSAVKHLGAALAERRARRSVHLLLALVAGRKGLALAQRVAPID